MKAFVLDKNTRDLTPDVFENGRFRILSAAYWRTTTNEERGLLAVKHGLYVLPTVELVERLRFLIAGRPAIEIGSGNGVLAEALNIPATDNHMQEIPKYRAIYAATGQTPITYGANVERLDAHAAIRKYRPKVVVAAWVTHRYEPLRPQAGGNEIGVAEERILDEVESYVFVGNRSVHAGKKIWDRPHDIDHPDYVFSRAMNGTPNFIAVWGSVSAPISPFANDD